MQRVFGLIDVNEECRWPIGMEVRRKGGEELLQNRKAISRRLRQCTAVPVTYHKVRGPPSSQWRWGASTLLGMIYASLQHSKCR